MYKKFKPKYGHQQHQKKTKYLKTKKSKSWPNLYRKIAKIPGTNFRISYLFGTSIQMSICSN